MEAFFRSQLKVNRVLYYLRFFRSSTTELLRQSMAPTNDATYEQRCRLQRLQERSHVSSTAQAWLAHTRRQYFTAVLLYEILNFSSPSKQSFRAAGVRLWNSLPWYIKSLPSLTRFKSALYEHLFRLTDRIVIFCIYIVYSKLKLTNIIVFNFEIFVFKY